MKRRRFLRNISLSGLVIPAFFSDPIVKDRRLGFNEANDKKKGKALAGNDEFPLNETSIDALQQRMGKGELTSLQITQLYLKRIEEVDKGAPALHAVIEINPDATRIAASMDEERRSGKVRGPLHGIPIHIKDNINSGDAMMTTAGSLALAGHKAKEDAFIVKKIRAAGAVLLGKTNLSEWANYRSTHSSSGWSSRGGQTKNPYMLGRTPSGSSSGSGAAVAANLCALAIGTETDGSIVSPASVNGIVGIKPTVGLVSRTGIIPISFNQDTAGPMARSVKDAAYLLAVIAGDDAEDKATARFKKHGPIDYIKSLTKDALIGKRIGVEKSLLGPNPDVDKLFNAAIELLADLGATMVEVDLLKSINTLQKAEQIRLSYEFKDGINKYLKKEGFKMDSLKALIQFNREHESTAMPFFKQEVFIESENRNNLNDAEYEEANGQLKNSRSIIDTLLNEQKLDGITAPTNGLSWLIEAVNGDYDTGYSFSMPAAISGYPHVTVPMGMVHHLPIGISFMGTAYSEATLLGMAYAYEQASQHRKAPQFITDNNLE